MIKISMQLLVLYFPNNVELLNSDLGPYGKKKIRFSKKYQL